MYYVYAAHRRLELQPHMAFTLESKEVQPQISVLSMPNSRNQKTIWHHRGRQLSTSSGHWIDGCRVQKNKSKSIAEIKEMLRMESEEIKAEDIWVCKTIGEYGLSLLRPNIGILTHCNAGQLATAKYGTATAPIYLGTEKGYNFKVFADETRPLLQGARLTAFELDKAGVDVTLICDNMASTVMANGWVQAVFVGCDRVVPMVMPPTRSVHPVSRFLPITTEFILYLCPYINH